MTSWQVIEGDCREVLGTLDAGSVQTCVTSPPYFGLRDYGHDGQIGLEPTPAEFVAAMVAVFREVGRVLRDDGTVWLNLGDSYAGGGSGAPSPSSTLSGNGHVGGGPQRAGLPQMSRGLGCSKPKDLLGIPWMVAFALRADGWYLRSDIIWHKPNPMPESVTDRPTKAHEYLFLLSKSPRYYYDADAIREPHDEKYIQNRSEESYAGSKSEANGRSDRSHSFVKRYSGRVVGNPLGRNKRSVWTIATQPYAGAHFATFPPALILPCILAGCPEGGTVLDPFNGAGTTGVVALRNNRSYVGIELNPEYADLARNRIRDDAPLLNQMTEEAA